VIKPQCGVFCLPWGKAMSIHPHLHTIAHRSNIPLCEDFHVEGDITNVGMVFLGAALNALGKKLVQSGFRMVVK
jgi:hypothetical protein